MDLFAERITDAAAGRNISELADIVGIHRATFYRYFNGYSTPTLELAARIADELGVTVAYLAGE